MTSAQRRQARRNLEKILPLVHQGFWRSAEKRATSLARYLEQYGDPLAQRGAWCLLEAVEDECPAWTPRLVQGLLEYLGKPSVVHRGAA